MNSLNYNINFMNAKNSSRCYTYDELLGHNSQQVGINNNSPQNSQQQGGSNLFPNNSNYDNNSNQVLNSNNNNINFVKVKKLKLIKSIPPNLNELKMLPNAESRNFVGKNENRNNVNIAKTTNKLTFENAFSFNKKASHINSSTQMSNNNMAHSVSIANNYNNINTPMIQGLQNSQSRLIINNIQGHLQSGHSPVIINPIQGHPQISININNFNINNFNFNSSKLKKRDVSTNNNGISSIINSTPLNVNILNPNSSLKKEVDLVKPMSSFNFKNINDVVNNSTPNRKKIKKISSFVNGNRSGEKNENEIENLAKKLRIAKKDPILISHLDSYEFKSNLNSNKSKLLSAKKNENEPNNMNKMNISNKTFNNQNKNEKIQTMIDGNNDSFINEIADLLNNVDSQVNNGNENVNKLTLEGEQTYNKETKNENSTNSIDINLDKFMVGKENLKNDDQILDKNNNEEIPEVPDPRINFAQLQLVNSKRPQTSYGGLSVRQKNLQKSLRQNSSKITTDHRDELFPMPEGRNFDENLNQLQNNKKNIFDLGFKNKLVQFNQIDK